MEKSPLARLHPELRNAIYDEVLVQEHPISVSSRTWLYDGERRPALAALLQTCRRIRDEAKGIFYSVNSFLITTISRRDTYDVLQIWLRALQYDTRKLLTRIFVNETVANAVVEDEELPWNEERLRDCREFMEDDKLLIGEARLFVRGEDGAWITG